MTVELSDEEYEDLKQRAELVDIKSEDAEDPALEDIWLAGQPVGKIIESNRKEIKEAENELENVQSSGHSPNEADENMENTLPIQQVTKIWRVGGTIKANKTEHAAAIWSDFMDRCKKGRESYYLDSGEVTSIIREHFRDDESHLGVSNNTKRATVHRAMDALLDLAGNLVKKDTLKSGRSALIINQHEFEDFYDALESNVTDDVTPHRDGAVTRGA